MCVCVYSILIPLLSSVSSHLHSRSGMTRDNSAWLLNLRIVFRRIEYRWDFQAKQSRPSKFPGQMIHPTPALSSSRQMLFISFKICQIMP